MGNPERSASLADNPDRLAAALAERYRLERELGQGGMATVYLAEDLRHARKVAIKVLREDLAASLGATRFLREIQIAAQLQHPNILPLLDSGEADGFLYYVMPFVPGQSLRERLAREGELPVHDAVRLLIEITDALAHAHQMGVVHRDVKPDNVMMSGRHALVTDFGVAKAISEATGRNTITTLGVALGTPAYMSPEQAAADPHVDHRSDIYAVGVVAYELLTGRPPFTGATPQQVLASHVTEAPEPVAKRRSAISAPLEQVVMRCLAKRPADRYQSADELLAALEAQATPSTGITPAQTRPTAAWQAPAAHRRWFLPAAIGLGAILLASTVWWLRRDGGAIEIVNPQRIQVTRTGTAEFAATPSPDGQRLAYAERRCDDAHICTYDLVVQDIGGAGSLRVVEGMQAIYVIDWSGNGRTLLVGGLLAGGQVAFYAVPSLGGAAPRLVTNSSVAMFGDADSAFTSAMPSPGRLVLRSMTLDQPARGDSLVIERAGLDVFNWGVSPDGRWIFVSVPTAGGERVVVHDRRGVPRDSLDLPNPRSAGFVAADRIAIGIADSSDAELMTIREYRVDDRGRIGRRYRVVATQLPTAQFRATSGGLAYLTGITRSTVVAMAREGDGVDGLTFRTVASSTGPLGTLMGSDGAHVIIWRPDPANPGRIRLSVQPFEGGAETPLLGGSLDLDSDRSRTVDGKGLVTIEREGNLRRITEFDLATGRRTDRGTMPDSGGLDAIEVMRDGSIAWHPEGPLPTMRIRDRSGTVRSVALPDVRPVQMEDSPFGHGILGWGWSTPFADSVVVFHVPPGATEGRSLVRTVFEFVPGMRWLPDGDAELVVGETLTTSAFYRLDVETGTLRREGTIPLNFITVASSSNDGRRMSLLTNAPTLDAWVMRWD